MARDQSSSFAVRIIFGVYVQICQLWGIYFLPRIDQQSDLNFFIKLFCDKAFCNLANKFPRLMRLRREDLINFTCFVILEEEGAIDVRNRQARNLTGLRMPVTHVNKILNVFLQ